MTDFKLKESVATSNPIFFHLLILSVCLTLRPYRLTARRLAQLAAIKSKLLQLMQPFNRFYNLNGSGFERSIRHSSHLSRLN
ncbi:hypothetical protein QQP08_000429 [Theobroma cacao]|uniref:Uncharacterized protein n=1 Tax=Theobroma cacao TaxID=3641 RepID=A0A061DR79_THECC|nr:Uncharacterized protein TCM_004840 [Theobroma cacao]WRX07942.1 hypothetical protein QQP08_000429 [Theobroma cacao]